MIKPINDFVNSIRWEEVDFISNEDFNNLIIEFFKSRNLPLPNKKHVRRCMEENGLDFSHGYQKKINYRNVRGIKVWMEWSHRSNKNMAHVVNLKLPEVTKKLP